jgi:anaerobic ribonucleoside-triphosphate reductase
MTITVTGGDMSVDEINAYKEMAIQNHPDKVINSMEIHVDGDYVDLRYSWKTVPFDRVRRITGYLALTNHFNYAKQAEEKDRVKHS